MKIIDEIESTNMIIRSKDNFNSFDPKALNKFEFTYFITLEIVRYELITNNKLCDLTSQAISQLFTFQCFEFYYRDFPNVYIKTANLFSLFSEYNINLKNNDLDGISVDNSDWLDYFGESLKIILQA